MKKETLCTIASGSGGHILPALIAARTWHQNHPQGTVIFCTGTSKLDATIAQNYPFIASIKHFNIAKFIPKKVWLYPVVMLQVCWALLKSFWVIIKHRPATIISTGGLIAFPLCFAGRLLGSRVEVYELNVVPGKAVKLLMPFAHVIYTPFDATKKHCRMLGINFAHKCQPSAYPLRFTQQDTVFDKATTLATINRLNPTMPFTPTRKTVFLLGGSQGSLMLNTALKNFLQQASPTTRNSLQVIHQTGNLGDNDWKSFYQTLEIPAITFSYHEQVKDFYNLADLIICRAGAGTIFEVAFFGKPCIVIPLVASSTAHQVDNAREIAKQYPQLFTMIEQGKIATTPQILYDCIMKKLEL